tara:strand:+ start:428 stop:718 length:291 start_codon:yes stop_codon:yes gene_type:complete
MIQIENEQVITFTDAIKMLPRRRRRKKIHISTLYRWASRGIRNIRLETIQIGGTRCTSVEAVQRFFDAISTTPTHVHHKNKKRIEEAEQNLKNSGF